MTVGTVKTQGTHLYFVDTVSSSTAELFKLACPTGITGLGGPKDQIESTCLDSAEKEYVAGMGNPAPVTVPFNLIPRDGSHQVLFDLKEAGTTIPWMACLSESATAPTLDSDDTIIAAADRTCFAFDAYVADVNIDIANNEIVRGTLTLQRSGPVTPSWYVPA